MTPPGPFTLLGDPAAAACEGDACLVVPVTTRPEAVVAPATDADPGTDAGTDAGPGKDAAARTGAGRVTEDDAGTGAASDGVREGDRPREWLSPPAPAAGR